MVVGLGLGSLELGMVGVSVAEQFPARARESLNLAELNSVSLY
jgi:hypothetical protein